MKLTNAKILNSTESLSRLLSQPLPINISFKLKKLKNVLIPLIELINDGLKDVNDRFTVKDNDGIPAPVTDKLGKVVPGYFIISQEGATEREMLLAVENDVEFDVINITDLPEKTLLSEYDLEILDWLLV
jgi:hypothetical protein